MNSHGCPGPPSREDRFKPCSKTAFRAGQSLEKRNVHNNKSNTCLILVKKNKQFWKTPCLFINHQHRGIRSYENLFKDVTHLSSCQLFDELTRLSRCRLLFPSQRRRQPTNNSCCVHQEAQQIWRGTSLSAHSAHRSNNDRLSVI